MECIMFPDVSWDGFYAITIAAKVPVVTSEETSKNIRRERKNSETEDGELGGL